MAERIFMKLLPNDSGENVVYIVVPKWGLPPTPNNFLGAKNWKIAKNADLELATMNFDCSADAFKKHERVNAFNLVQV